MEHYFEDTNYKKYQTVKILVGIFCMVVGLSIMVKGVMMSDHIVALGSIPCTVIGYVLIDPFGQDVK